MAVTARVLSWVLLVGGAVAITVGVGLWSVPAGVITGGVLALLVGLFVVDVDSPVRIEVRR